MPRYHIWTVGCQMNKAESERLAAYFEARGDQPAATADDADFIVLNSCVVRQSAENRVRHKIDALTALKTRRPEVKLALTGCLVDANTDALKQQYPQLDYVFGAGAAPGWEDAAPPWLMPPGAGGVTAYVPIMQGCDNFCSYCIVPYRRGRERSRPVEEIISEVGALAARGVREVTLLGQNVDSYGRGLPGEPDLAQLLRELNPIDGIRRIRFLTNHPKDMGTELIRAVAELDKVCEHINLPVQAGNDRILELMRRGYTVAQYRALVAEIRAHIPGVSLATDVILAFPGETEAEFRDTLNLISELKFDTVHLAAYSVRQGTIAARELKDSISAAEKKARLREAETLQETIATEINRNLLGREVEVLVEGRKKGKWWGRSRGDKLVFFTGAAAPGELRSVTVTGTGPWSLQGELR